MKQSIHIRLCSPNEFQDVINCKNSVIGEMVQSDFYFPSTSDELKLLFENNIHIGFIAGAYYSEHLIGFASVASWLDPYYYGYLHNSDHICYSIEDTAVRAAYHGNGLQLKLWTYIIDLLPKNAVLMCTIHPENIYSMQNAVSLNFAPKMSTQIFDNSPRLIMRRDATM